MAVTTFPSSLPSPRRVAGAAAAGSRRRVDPDRVESSTAAVKKAKRPRSCHGDEPPAKRRRAGKRGDSPGPTPMMLAAEKDGVNHLISILPPGCSPHEVNPLPDSVVSVLQENGARRIGGADGDDEIEVYTLGDAAPCAIKDGIGAYVDGRAPLRRDREEEAPSRSKEGVTGLSRPRSMLSRTAPKNIPSRAATKRILPRSSPMSTRPGAAPMSIPSGSAPTSIPSMSMPAYEAEFSGIPLKAVPSVLSSTMPWGSRESVRGPANTAISRSLPMSATLTASTPVLAPAKPLVSGESLTKPVKTAGIIQCQLMSTPATTSWSELLSAANKACEKVMARRREIEKLRTAARQEVEQMVRTVDFNDPYIDYTDVFK